VRNTNGNKIYYSHSFKIKHNKLINRKQGELWWGWGACGGAMKRRGRGGSK